MTQRSALIAIFIAASMFSYLVGGALAATPSAGCSRTTIESGRRLEKQVEVGELRRDFILDVPEAIAPGQPAALLFDFHGFSHSGAGVWKVSAFKALAERHGFITVYPTGLPITLELLGESHVGPGWQMAAGGDNRDLAFTRAMLAEIEAAYCIDLDRIFATGFSNGAFFSSLLGCEMSDRFAAIAPVAGGNLRSDCKPARPLPVMIHHGTRDPLIDVERGRASRDQWLAADGCEAAAPDALPGAPRCERQAKCRDEALVVYCEEDFAHSWPQQATERIWGFFQGITRDRRTAP